MSFWTVNNILIIAPCNGTVIKIAGQKAISVTNQRMRSNESIRESIKQFAVVFANEHRAKFAICRASFSKSKERTCAPARFPVLKDPIRRETVCAKQAGHFPLFNCPALEWPQRLTDVALGSCICLTNRGNLIQLDGNLIRDNSNLLHTRN